MSDNVVTPDVGEIWSLYPPGEDWQNGLVIDIKGNGKKFVTAKITNSELPANYEGSNIEIYDSFNTKVSVPFVILLDSLKDLPTTYFETKRGQLSKQDFDRVLVAYSKIVNHYLE